jgi:hypothetical protein
MQQVLQPRWFYAREFVGRDDLHIREEERRVKACVRVDAGLDFPSGDADLVDDVSKRGDLRMIRPAAQHIECVSFH